MRALVACRSAPPEGRRPRLLDLYCGAGGCSVGWSWAHRGRLVSRGTRDGGDLYRFGDAHQLWRQGDRGEDARTD